MQCNATKQSNPKKKDDKLFVIYKLFVLRGFFFHERKGRELGSWIVKVELNSFANICDVYIAILVFFGKR